MNSASAPTAPAASIISSPSCSTQWPASRPTTSPIAARRRRLTDLIGGRIEYTFDGVVDVAGLYSGGHHPRLWASPDLGARRSCRMCRRFPKRRCRASTPRSGSACSRPPARPSASIELVNSKVNAVLAPPEREGEAFEKLGIEPVGGGPDVLADRVQTEMQKWASIVRDKNIHHRAIMREIRPCQQPSARCISACSCSAPAIIPPAGAMEGAHASSCSWPVMQTIAADRRARQIRPVLHLRRAGDGPRRSSVVRQRASSRRRCSRALSAVTTPHRPRRHGIDELRRAVPCRARLRLARPSQRRPRRLERRHQHQRHGRAQFQQEQHDEHDLRYEIATEFVDVVRGLWDSWDDGAIVADRATRHLSSTSRRCARSITRGGSFR